MYHNYVNQLRSIVDTLTFIEPNEAQQYIGDIQDVTHNLINSIQRNNTDDMTVTLGQNFQISKDENATTGYTWQVTVSPGLEIVNDQFIPGNPGRLGSPGKRIWTLKGIQKGSQVFTAVYERPWLPPNNKDEVYTVNINVI